MVVASAGLRQEASAPPLVPAEPAIDREHLARMTLGERTLEQEVLALFDRQATMLLARMHAASPAVIAAAAHTLKGSALGLGAFKVARAAEAVERASVGGAEGLSDEVQRLCASVGEVRVAIADLLETH